MKRLKIGRNWVEIYDSVDEMPMERFHVMNKYLIIESGIGSSFQDFHSHLSLIKAFVEVNDKESAYTELENLSLSLNFGLNGENFSGMAFCATIKTINGKEIHDISDEGLKRTLQMINGEKKGFIKTLIDEVKKKIDNELDLLFPSKFDNSKEKEFYSAIKRKLMLTVDSVVNGLDISENVKSIDKQLLKLSTPTKFTGSNGFEIRYSKNFESSCLLIGKKFGVNAKKMTVHEYFEALGLIEKEK